MKKQSKELTLFYNQWLAWAEEGGKQENPFDNTVGLCTNLIDFCDKNGFDSKKLSDEMTNQFVNESNCQVYFFGECFPFGRNEYEEYRYGKMHLDPKRLQWVREHSEIVP